MRPSTNRRRIRFRAVAIVIVLCLALAIPQVLAHPAAHDPALPKPNDDASPALAADTNISGGQVDQFNSAVAYSESADAYLVVWEYAYTGTDHDIYARRVDADGQPLGPAFAIASSATWEANPAIAYSESMEEYLVVWERSPDQNTCDVLARRVSASGELNPSFIQVAISEPMEVQPDVAAHPTNGDFLVVWAQDANPQGTAQWDLYARRVDKFGAPQGSATAVSAGLLNELEPAVAFGTEDGEYMVTWRQGVQITPPLAQSAASNAALASPIESDIHARRVATNGSPTGSEIVVCNWEYDQIMPRLAYNDHENQFLIVWEDHHWGWGADWDIYGRLLDADGTLDGAQFGISWEGEEARSHPDVVHMGGSNVYMVTWEYEYTPSDHDIYARCLFSTGTVKGLERAICSTRDYQRGAAIANGDDVANLIVWADDRDDPDSSHRVYGTLGQMAGFYGHVKRPDAQTGAPLPGVSVALYCSENEPDAGELVDSTTTGRTGAFALYTCRTCEFYNVIETDPPGFHSTAVETIGGWVKSYNWLQFLHPLAGTDTTGNVFWDDYDATLTPTPSQTPSVTPTGSRTATCTPTSTPSVTPTGSRTATITPTSSPSVTPTGSRTASLTPTSTPSVTPTGSRTASVTPTATATPTGSVMPTGTVTIETTPTRTVTPTATGDTASIAMRVLLERRTDNSGSRVCVGSYCATTGADGIYTLSGLAPGGYDLSVSRASYLRAANTMTLTAGTAITLPDLTLRAGDINQDDSIELADAVIMGHAWGSAPANGHWDGRCDITDDQVVDVLDLVAVQYNWYGLGPTLWPLTASPRFASAATASVIISPALATLDNISDTVQCDIVIRDVEDLYGASAIVTFDPAIVQVLDSDPRPSASGIQVAPGTLMNPVHSQVAYNEVDNTTGQIHFAAFMTHPATPFDGDGVLCTITLQAIAEGSTDLRFDGIRLLDDALPEPGVIPSTTTNGRLRVGEGDVLCIPIILKRY